ncbi:Carboxylesterase [Ancylostoma caninum]|uniref:Carboxylesterase n=1 Tax=Ancylostoma caninum TaxID=29170 RepID=A0A368FUJ7_ANCCA|nr:Carboxylesterase [Ancylostoma caninum]
MLKTTVDKFTVVFITSCFRMITLLIVVSYVIVASSQVLHLKPGKVQGFEHRTKNGDFAEVFLNIPYASPSVGELRFEKPVPPVPWDDIRDGTKFGASCHPIVPEAAFPPEQPSEDCLTLNVIRPKKKAPPSGFPVLFWVHGGGYEVGSALFYGYKGFADIYIPSDIIVVTIQYRLGVYGFFSTGDSHIPGNLGLFDMAEALKFIHTNAENIGADPWRVTVWGHSAGSAAVGQLILSPVTRDYIARSIEMSGSPWAFWAIGASVAKNSLELAEALGCQSDIKECMKGKTVEEIYKGIEKVHPDQMSTTAPPKATIVGVTNKESSIFSIMGVGSFFQRLTVDPADYSNWNRDRLISELKKIVQKVYIGNHLEELLSDIVSYYVDRDEQKQPEFYIDRYSGFLSDLLFIVPSADGIVARRAAGWDIHAYVLDHYNEALWNNPMFRHVPKKLRGAPHGCEFQYTKDVNLLNKFDFNEEEQVVADVFRQSFIEFVKTGGTSNNHEEWLDVGAGTDLRFLRITPNPKMRQGFYNETTSFWRNTLRYGFNMMQLLPAQKSGKEIKQEL